jgi:hypothetical protein
LCIQRDTEVRGESKVIEFAYRKPVNFSGGL